MSEVSPENQLLETILSFRQDPLGHVRFCYPWGKKFLTGWDGPDKIQTQILGALGEEIRAGNPNPRIAVSSGHGIGKTAMVSWIIRWFMDCHADPQGVVTANTETQLRTKTWRELAKWHSVAINNSWHIWTKTQYKLASAPDTWFTTAVPWSENSSQAFAGTHEKHVLIIFDEASEIADIIWEVAEGAMTTLGAIWVAFGNPTRNTGRFRQCWTKYREQWRTFNVDARDSKIASQNKWLHEQWLKFHDEDDDFIRVRLRGEFPRQSVSQFISEEVVQHAIDRKVEELDIPLTEPVILGCDIARHGQARNVICPRRGRLVFDYGIEAWHSDDLMATASRIAAAIDRWQADIVFIDATGLGAGVYDRLVQLGYRNVVAVFWGQAAKPRIGMDEAHFYNHRTQCWHLMGEWLKTGSIPDNRELYEDLIGPERFWDARMRVRLEKKEDMEKRGIASPDIGDALALTFSEPVAPRDHGGMAGSGEPDFE